VSTSSFDAFCRFAFTFLEEQRVRYLVIGGLAVVAVGEPRTTADADAIKDTANAQPLIVAAGLLSFKALGITPSVVAGHSVGEITAAAITNIISETDAMKIVRTRGSEMAKAAAITPAGRSAV
jgi:[acyl-carrier-protein] S-malonyltransferase